MKYFGLWVIFMAIVYSHIQTRFFGGHWFPSCEAEVIADGISVVVFSLGILILSLGREFDKLNQKKNQ